MTSSSIYVISSHTGNAVLKVKLDSGTEETLTMTKNFADNKNHYVKIMRNMKEVRFQVR